MNKCIVCECETNSKVTGELGNAQGVLCEDCAQWCDGNVIEGSN